MSRYSRNSQSLRSDTHPIWNGVKGVNVICDLLSRNLMPIGARRWDVKGIKNYIELVYDRLKHLNKDKYWINDDDDFDDLLFFNTQLNNLNGDFVYLCKITDTFGGDSLSRLFFVSISDLKNRCQQFEEKLYFLELLSNKLHSPMRYCQRRGYSYRIEYEMEELKKNIGMGDYDIYRLGKLVDECPPSCKEFLSFTKAALEKDKALLEKLYYEKKEDIPPVSFVDEGSPSKVSSDFGADFSIDTQESRVEANKRERRKGELENLRNSRDSGMSGPFSSLKSVKSESIRISHTWSRFKGIDHLVIDGIDNLPLFLRYKIVTEDYIKDIVELQLSMLEDEKKYDIIKEELKDCVHDSMRRVKAGNISIAPMYYAENHSISYLLPLFFTKNRIADCALIMSWDAETKVFTARTIINMWEAYNDIRLLSNPDDYSWLY